MFYSNYSPNIGHLTHKVDKSLYGGFRGRTRWLRFIYVFQIHSPTSI